MHTFKVARVVAARMLPQSFELRRDFDVDALLSSAWGIVWGEGEEVGLRFTPDVAYRVKESRWHPSQHIEDLADDSCLLTLSVASMMEIGRWLRGWGDRVEVLAPSTRRRRSAVRMCGTHQH